MKIRKSIIGLFLLPCLLLFALIYLIPIGLVAVSSFFTWKAGTAFTFIGLKNYIDGFFDPNIRRALLNTMIWAVLQSTVHVGLGTLLAVILSRKFKGWKFFRTIYMIPNVISMAALSIIMINVFNPEIGLLNSAISGISGRKFNWNWYYAFQTSFFTVTLGWLLFAGLITVLMLAAIQSVSTEVQEAARIDGATRWQIDRMIILPLVRGSLGTAVIISATSMLREFEMIFLTTNGGPGNMTLNLPLYLYKTALNENNYGYANMMGMILVAAGIMIVVLINKIFRMDESDY